MTLMGIISDRHGLLRPEAIDALTGSDLILHAGDIGPSTLLDRLNEIAPTNAEGQRFSGHSLRIGFSVAAAEAGADIRAIASVTRHKSMAMPARYAQKAEQMRTSPHRLKGVGLSR
jgi:site-specific recombinase XerD